MANLLNHPKAQLAATALISGAVVASAIFGYQAVRRQEKVEDLKSSIPQLGEGHIADEVGLFSFLYNLFLFYGQHATQLG